MLLRDRSRQHPANDGRYAQHGMRVAFVASEDTIRTVAASGFDALPSEGTVLLTEGGPKLAKQMDGRAAALLEVPEDTLSPFEHQAEQPGQPRTFAVPRSVVEPFPILAAQPCHSSSRMRPGREAPVAGGPALLQSVPRPGRLPSA